MADESQNPYWERMSGEVKNVLIQAMRWSTLAKKPRVYCDHIMTALASSYPEAVQLIAEKGCTEKWGARNLERTVNETINSPLAIFITGKSDTTIRILITDKNTDFEFKEIKKFFS